MNNTAPLDSIPSKHPATAMHTATFGSYQQLDAFLALFRAHCSPTLYEQIHQGHSAHFCLALFSFLQQQGTACTVAVLERKSTHLPSGTIEEHPYSHSFCALFDHYFDVLGSGAPEHWAAQWPLDTYWKTEFFIHEKPNTLDFIALLDQMDQQMLERIQSTLQTTFDHYWIQNR